MPDKTTTVAELRDALRRFVDERDWQQFHTPKNLAMSIAIETAELMEHFQWLSPAAARDLSEADLQNVREELADIFCYALSFANAMGIDVSDAVREKMIKNAVKYPVDRVRGKLGV